MTFLLLRSNIHSLQRISSASTVTSSLKSKKTKKKKDDCVTPWKRVVVEKLYNEYEIDRFRFSAEHNTIIARNRVVG